MKNEAQYYFPHDVRARSDIKIRAVVSEFGLAGYGAWWVVVELLRESEGYVIPDASWSMKALAAELPGIDVEAFLDILVDTGLLVRDSSGFSSPSLLRRMGKLDNIRAKRAESGARGGRKKKIEEVEENQQDVQNQEPERVGFPDDHPAMVLSVFMWDEIKKWNNSMKEPSFQQWAKAFDLMLRIDKRDPKWLSQAIRSVQKDEFWRRNVLSPSKFREKLGSGIIEEVVNGSTGKNRNSSIPNKTAESNDYDL